MLQKSIESHATMSLTMKGIAALILLTVLLCAESGNLIVIYVSMGVTILLFFLDMFFLRKKCFCEMELGRIIEKEAPTLKLPVLYYGVVFIIILIKLFIIVG